jgi:hypothetical protein
MLTGATVPDRRPSGSLRPPRSTFAMLKMGKLYEVGYRTAIAGPVWATRPPGLQCEVAP